MKLDRLSTQHMQHANIAVKPKIAMVFPQKIALFFPQKLQYFSPKIAILFLEIAIYIYI